VISIYVISNRASRAVDYAAFAPVCQGEGVASAASYNGGTGPHPVVVLEDGKRTSNIGAPKGWLPTSVESTELVACAGPSEKYVMETCSYVGGAEIKRYGYQQEVQLFAAQTGELIVAETVQGASPRSCGQVEERSVKSLTGKNVVLWDWLQRYVEPNVPTSFGETGVSEEGIAVSVLEVNWDAWDEIKAIKNFHDDFHAPAEDEIYLMVTVQIQNTGDYTQVNFLEEEHFQIQSGNSFYPEADLFRLFHFEHPLKPQDEFSGNLGFKLPKSAIEEELLLLYREGEVVLSLK
jgi:hypothetical protein